MVAIVKCTRWYRRQAPHENVEPRKLVVAPLASRLQPPRREGSDVQNSSNERQWAIYAPSLG